MTGFPNAAPATDTSAPLYFLHIPKTAGTTAHTFITSQFGEDNVCPAHLWWQKLQVTPLQAARAGFIWGHFYAYLHRYVPVPLRYITFLRDPVERALSHYGHITYHTGHYLHGRAMELGSFSACLRDPVIATAMTNFQVRSLTVDFDPVALAVPLTAQQLTQLNELERLLETAPPAIPDAQALRIAQQRLDQMCFVGIVEEWDHSIALLCATFGWPVPPAIRSENIGRERLTQAQLDPADLTLLRSLNAEDIALYARAKSKLLAA